MIKIFKTLVLAGVVIGAIGIASYNIMASDRVENLALEDYKAGQKDYKAGENQSAKDILPKKKSRWTSTFRFFTSNLQHG